MSRVLLLLSKTSYRASDFLRAAEKLYIDVVVGSDQDNVLASSNSAKFIQLDFYNVPAATKHITEFDAAHPLLSIVPVDELSGPVAAAASEVLGLVQNPFGAVCTTGNKFDFRQFLKSQNLSDVDFELIDRTGNTAEVGRNLTYPAVLKPLTLSGSRGVIRVNNNNEFGEAVDRIGNILDGLENMADESVRRYILAETYIPGMEIAIEALIENGKVEPLAIFDKPDPLEGPYFEETIYVTPSRLCENLQNEAVSLVQKAVSLLGLVTGPIHAELRLHGENIELIELSPRSIGGLCSRVLEFGAGFSLEEVILQQIVGNPTSLKCVSDSAAGVMMIPNPNAGVLKSVSGIDDAQNVNGISDIVISIPIGGEVVPLPDGNKYLGFIFARGDTPAEAEQSLRSAHHLLSFTVSKKV